jgi:Mg2+/Co2+ transporter CorB
MLMLIIHIVILIVIRLTIVPCNLCQIFKTPSPDIQRKPTSTEEIEKVIKSLKSKIHMNMMKCPLNY